MKGENPNSPFDGSHIDEKSKSLRGFTCRIGIDLWNRAAPIMKTRRLESMAIRREVR